MAVDHAPFEAVAGSFRDPRGFVFRRDGILLRQVNQDHDADLRALRTSGLYERLVADGSLIPHEEVDPAWAAEPGAVAVLRPELLPMISYPYEWSFSQLREAALTTLRIQETALDHGMSLRDASAYNVQFRGTAPVFIDTLSFEVLTEGRPWVAYRQFCEQFLAPLALMSYRDVRLGRLLRSYPDGIPLDLTAGLLPSSARRRPTIQLHVAMHARSQAKHAADPAPRSSSKPFGPKAFRGLLESLRSGIDRLEPAAGRSAWSGYYDEATHYSDEDAARKVELVDAWIEELHPRTVWDLGANTGRFSLLASDRGIPTVAFDADPSCVDTAFRDGLARGDRHLLPLVMDLTDPSPGLGWAGEERMGLEDRGPADLVLALALIHHLAIGHNVPLPRIADLLSRIGTSVAIEFVPKEDVRVEQLLRHREDVFPDYSQAAFEAAAGSRFLIERREPLGTSGRTLYLLRRR